MTRASSARRSRVDESPKEKSEDMWHPQTYVEEYDIDRLIQNPGIVEASFHSRIFRGIIPLDNCSFLPIPIPHPAFQDLQHAHIRMPRVNA